jgi:hypothetical protein
MALSTSELIRLAFWSKNMIIVRESNSDWPGFSYEKSEWSRMKMLAKPVSDGAYLKFIGLNAIIFILFAAIAIVCVLLPLLLLFYPDTRDLEPLPFVLLLASTTFIAIGIGLPLSMRISAWICASKAMRRKKSSTAQDRRLAARVSWQLMRITLVTCGLLVPGMLLFIALGMDGGLKLMTVKITCSVILLATLATMLLRKT